MGRRPRQGFDRIGWCAVTTTTTTSARSLEDRLTLLYNHDEEQLKDPFALYKEMRQSQPVMRINGVVVVSRYDDIQDVFRDTEQFSNRRMTGSRVAQRRLTLTAEELPMYDHLLAHDTHHIGQNDPPDHTRLRRFVNQPFSARAIDAQRQTVVDLANGILDEIDAQGDDPFDLALYSWRLPFAVVCRMLDIPDAKVVEFRDPALAWRRGLGSNYDNLPEAFEAIRFMEDYVGRVVEDRRHVPSSGDLISHLLAADIDGSRLSDAELVTMFALMLTSGNANDAISNAVITLSEHPEQRQFLVDNPDDWRGAVDEFFRYCPPAHGVHRVAKVDCEIGGFPVKTGETVRLVVASAGRDENKFESPETLDVTRKEAREHLDFGFGLHRCVGQWLARLDIEVGLRELYRRHPELTVAGPFEFRSEYQFRGPKVLMVTRG